MGGIAPVNFILSRRGEAGLPSCFDLAAERLLGASLGLEAIALLGVMINASIYLHPGGVQEGGLQLITSVDQISDLRVRHIFFSTLVGACSDSFLSLLAVCVALRGLGCVVYCGTVCREDLK